MGANDESTVKPGLFGKTDWDQIEQLKQAPEAARLPILDLLARNYWMPICHYLRLHGNDEHEAQELTQEFFEFALATRLFERASPERGRFRSFLLQSLKHFITNRHRKLTAQKRHPKEGVTSLDNLEYLGYFHPKSLIDRQTPEAIFHLIWLREVIRNALAKLEQEYSAAKQTSYFALFRSRVVAPVLEGVEPPSLQTQAEQWGLEYKVAANQVVSAKRAFARILEAEIRSYAGSLEDATADREELLAHFRLEARE